MNAVIHQFASGTAGASETGQTPARYPAYLSPRLGMSLHLLAWALALFLLMLVVIPEDHSPLHAAYRLTAIPLAAMVFLFCTFRLKIPSRCVAVLRLLGVLLFFQILFRPFKVRFVTREVPWHQYSLRSLLLFVTFVSIILGCFVWHMRPRWEFRRVEASILKSHGRVYGTPSLGAKGITDVDFYGRDNDLKQVKGYLEELPNLKSLSCWTADFTNAGLEHLEGLDNLQYLGLGETAVTDAGLKQLKDMQNLTELSLDGSQVTDAGLEHLKDLPALTGLDLQDTLVTDDGLKHLEGLVNLKWLQLQGTQVSDAGLKHLRGLKKLEDLMLDGTQISDAGLVHLKEMTSLRNVTVSGTAATNEGLAELWQALLGEE